MSDTVDSTLDEVVDAINDPVIDLSLGLAMLSTNILIFLLIQMHKSVRREKEYSLLALLVMFNSLFGILLIYQASTAKDGELIDRFSCILRPHIVGIPSVGVVMSTILPVMALDRFIAVYRPIYYYKLDCHCACKLATIVFVLFIGYSILLIVVSLTSRPTDEYVHCHLLDFHSRMMNSLNLFLAWTGHLTSVILYGAVILKLRKELQNKNIILSSTSERRIVAVQRIFGIFSAITVLLIIVPFAVMIIYELSGCAHTTIQITHAHSWFRIALKCSTMNPTLNVVAYALKHKQIYRGFQQVFSKKLSRSSVLSGHPQHGRVSAKMSVTV